MLKLEYRFMSGKCTVFTFTIWLYIRKQCSELWSFNTKSQPRFLVNLYMNGKVLEQLKSYIDRVTRHRTQQIGRVWIVHHCNSCESVSYPTIQMVQRLGSNRLASTEIPGYFIIFSLLSQTERDIFC